jgi:hypothetical protein
MDSFELLLDDYKIYVEHELNALKNKLENVKTMTITREVPPNGFNQFRNEFHKTVNNLYKQNKVMNRQLEENLILINNKTDNKINNGNLMNIRYVHTLFFINLTIIVVTNFLWIMF